MINLYCSNLGFHQYHHSHCSHGFNQLYLTLILTLLTVFIDGCELCFMHYKESRQQPG